MEQGVFAKGLFRAACRRAVLAVTMAAGFGYAATAHEGASGVVAERMDQMRAMKQEMKLVDEMLAGKKYLSRKRLGVALGKIKVPGPADLARLFPAGSDAHPSEADPAIWSDADGFARQWTEFAAALDALKVAAAAAAPADQLHAPFAKLNAACKSCHERFRK